MALPHPPETVFINGDLAFNSGEKTDYAAVVGLLQPLREAGMPVHLGMGNHDSRENFWQVLRASKTVQPRLPGRQATIVRMEQANWFVLDSLIKTLTTPGLLGEEQRMWLAGALDANANKPAIIMIHHQPGPLSAGKPGVKPSSSSNAATAKPGVAKLAAGKSASKARPLKPGAKSSAKGKTSPKAGSKSAQRIAQEKANEKKRAEAKRAALNLSKQKTVPTARPAATAGEGQ